MSMRVASAPVSWGVMENIELPDDYTPDRVLDEIVEAGYSGTELGPYGFLPSNPEPNFAQRWPSENSPSVPHSLKWI